ncbi:hypothetical protein AC579_6966 [Pseudocercospora musae]|uniref:Protein EFR3 n=1 Tax=Pseudocercospora musae TaxID=113226 RepID=A0A139IAD3_9PEZI|nr:hypothetical protein AC579_6966 [Pseudocercospora musae]
MPQVPGRPQRIRPKHQQLILKCYPRLPKNSAADVKPNSSELSYLLYYASTRQHKLPKVGHFLETRTTSDVYHWQSAAVHVTLQILTAILEHNAINRASGFALIAPFVLRIIREIVNKTNDISLIEATTGTWDVFCQHQDAASLAADSEYRALYVEVVRIYSDLAKNTSKKIGKATTPVASHDALRLRKAGVAAITSIFSPTEQFERVWNREFDGSMAAILSNLRNPDKRDYIEHFKSLINKSEDEEDKERLSVNRRQSIATVRTFSGLQEDHEPDPRAAEGTVQDADQLEEEEAGMLAIDCLKVIFQTQNRAQVRSATIAFMRYIAEEESRLLSSGSTKDISTWAAQLFRLVTQWTSVQDRFVILYTAQDVLGKLPIEGSFFRPHETYAKMIHSVVCSDLNLIGLSVMDVLIGLMSSVLRSVAYCSRPDTAALSRHNTASTNEKDAAANTIQQLKGCIACLASHVYYSDQVTDMIAAILVRVRAYPSASDLKKGIFGEEQSRSQKKPKGSVNGAAPSQRPATSADPRASNIDMSVAANESTADIDESTAEPADRFDSGSIPPETSPRTNSLRSAFFTTDEARKTALEIIKNIVEVAQKTSKQAHENAVINRNRVPVGVWDGTQWLARTGAEEVRNAYKDTVATWAKYESDEKDSNMLDFEADDCFGKFVEKTKPASLRAGSVGQSHQGHPQLLMLPNFGVERRLSSGQNTSNGTDHLANHKPSVRAKDLEDVLEGKRHVELHQQVSMGPGSEKANLRSLLAGLKIEEKRRPNAIMAAPPY